MTTVLFGYIFKTLEFDYLAAMKAEFDPLTAKMTACFHTNLPPPF